MSHCSSIGLVQRTWRPTLMHGSRPLRVASRIHETFTFSRLAAASTSSSGSCSERVGGALGAPFPDPSRCLFAAAIGVLDADRVPGSSRACMRARSRLGVKADDVHVHRLCVAVAAGHSDQLSRALPAGVWGPALRVPRQTISQLQAVHCAGPLRCLLWRVGSWNPWRESGATKRAERPREAGRRASARAACVQTPKRQSSEKARPPPGGRRGNSDRAHRAPRPRWRSGSRPIDRRGGARGAAPRERHSLGG